MQMHRKNANGFLAQALTETVKKNYPYAVLLILAIAAGAVISAWPSLVLKQIVDGPLASGGQGLWQYAFQYLGAILLLGLSDLVREYGSMVFGQRMLLNIRSKMLDRLRLLPMSYYLEVPAGETISRFTADIDAVNTLFTSGIISAVADLLKIIGLIVALFSLSPTLGYIALGALPIIYLLADYFRKNIYRKQLVVRKRVSDINTGIQEIFSGMKVIKVFGRERFFAGRFEPLLENHRIAMNANSIYDAWFPCITQTLRASVIAIAIFIGASNNMTSISLGLSLGTLAAAADLFIRLFDPIETAATGIQTIQQAMAGLNRIKAFFNQEIETAEKTDAFEAGKVDDITVVIENVRFAYQNGKDVLNGASMAIPTGAKAAIAGRTGSGKTTLMNLIAGLYPPKSGRITVGGVDPYLLPPSARRRLLGIVPQTVILFDGTIYENVTLRDDSITREQAEQALKTVGLYDIIQRLPDGLDTVIGEGKQKLSFGQTQLLSLARAIVTDPPLLLLDELTSGLDAVTERQVLSAIRNISTSKTIITISHRLSGIIDADIVHIIERGRIMESGAPQALAQKEGWYSRYKRLEDRNWRIS
jgi:ATP-binding cassette subfamily B protein